jgi:hypothetical protein
MASRRRSSALFRFDAQENRGRVVDPIALLVLVAFAVGYGVRERKSRMRRRRYVERNEVAGAFGP